MAVAGDDGQAGDGQDVDERVICHLVGRSAWSVGAAGYRPASLGSEGFIHFSTPAQVVATANRFYQGRDDLLLVVVDPARLSAPLRWEPPAEPATAVSRPGAVSQSSPAGPAGSEEPAVPGAVGAAGSARQSVPAGTSGLAGAVRAGGTATAGGELFPHLYGPIDAGAVTAVVPFPPEADGRFTIPSTLW